MRGAQLLYILHEMRCSGSEISLLRRKRTLRITEGGDNFLTPVQFIRLTCFFIILDGSVKGCFDLLSS